MALQQHGCVLILQPSQSHILVSASIIAHISIPFPSHHHSTTPSQLFLSFHTFAQHTLAHWLLTHTQSGSTHTHHPIQHQLHSGSCRQFVSMGPPHTHSFSTQHIFGCPLGWGFNSGNFSFNIWGHSNSIGSFPQFWPLGQLGVGQFFQFWPKKIGQRGWENTPKLPFPLAKNQIPSFKPLGKRLFFGGQGQARQFQKVSPNPLLKKGLFPFKKQQFQGPKGRPPRAFFQPLGGYTFGAFPLIVCAGVGVWSFTKNLPFSPQGPGQGAPQGQRATGPDKANFGFWVQANTFNLAQQLGKNLFLISPPSPLGCPPKPTIILKIGLP